VQGHRHRHPQHQRAQLQQQVAAGHAQHVAEEERGEVARERAALRQDDHAQGEHPDEQQPDRGVLAEGAAPLHEVHPADHHHRAQQGAQRQVEARQRGQRQAGQHAVGQRVAHERQPADHHPRAHHRRQPDGEQAGQQRPLHELQPEGVEQPGHVLSPRPW